MQVSRNLVAALMLGAGAMYLFDANRGARRRALLRDRGRHALRRVGEEAGKKARHLRNRARGVAAEARNRASHGDPVSDDLLAERVRAVLGRVVSDASAVAVTVSEGRVRLTGTIELNELNPLLHAVERVAGVEEVHDALTVRQLILPERRSYRSPGRRLLTGVAGMVGMALLQRALAGRRA